MTSTSDRMKRKDGNHGSGNRIEDERDASLPISTTRHNFHGLEKVTSDYRCFVCGAVFSTDEDRKQHLEKEADGKLQEDSTKEDMNVAKVQEELNESHAHRV